ncbi:CLOCK-interacting pacemaker isoform 1-T2 [Clarias gariepinus]
MPHKSSCVGRYPAHPASKNAKDKSNGASLLSRTKVHIQRVKNGRNYRCSSEKDSGYSDAGSDYQQTDVDDQHSTVTELKGRIPRSTADQRNHILVSGQAEFTPMFIIKNVVLKQPGQSAQDQVLQSLWESEGTNAQSNLLFLQQPSITVSPLRVLTPQLRRAESKNKKGKSTYLPILNSYPRIAPNLNKKKTEKPTSIREGSSEEHSLSKRVCTEEIKEKVPISTHISKKNTNKQLESHSLSHTHSFLDSLSSSGDMEQRSSCLSAPELKVLGMSAFTSLGSSSVSSSKTSTSSFSFSSSCSEPVGRLLPTSKMSTSGGSVSDQTTGLTRHRRFLNTVEILSQSGLLDITLRTQELLRQNAATEQNIAQLRHHTHLLCHAVHAGSNMPALENIHRVMVESGCYPNLRSLLIKGSDGDDLKADSSSRIDAMITYRCGFNEYGEVPPPCHLYTTQQVREDKDIPSLDPQDSTFGMEWLMPHGMQLPQKTFLVPPDSTACAVAAVDT